jgi:hypothetical protein
VTISNEDIRKVLHRLFKGEDYRIVVVDIINEAFLRYVMGFFRKVLDAKLKDQTITSDWYRCEFLNPRLKSKELAINAGLNQKTISNMYNSARREIVLEAVPKHYESLLRLINELVEDYGDMEITLTIRLGKVSVDLNISESLVVINTLAVKRAELRGGAWSSVGKQVEKSLLISLCKLYSVPREHYVLTGLSDKGREIDFFLLDSDRRRYRCEVKLMGKGNPESADAFYARDSQVFIADKLSDLNKRQLDGSKVHWVELRSENGFKRFGTVLKSLNIPHQDLAADFDRNLDVILKNVVS